jgi:hypothetical protein
MEQGRGRIAQKVHWNDSGKDMGENQNPNTYGEHLVEGH